MYLSYLLIYFYSVQLQNMIRTRALASKTMFDKDQASKIYKNIVYLFFKYTLLYRNNYVVKLICLYYQTIFMYNDYATIVS